MNDRAWAATHKGLFELRRNGAGWKVARVSFLGEPVTMLLPPQPDGRMLAALNLGHFGVKLHASDDAGCNWREVAAPTYPPQPADATGPAWKLVQIWALESAGERIWAGTLPGGLFGSDDFGASWQLNESLWNRPERLQWFGGGTDVPGLHSIAVHPKDAQQMVVGVSCGGAWITEDGGANWALRTRGMRADYMPPDQAENEATQDPHLIVRCRARPEVLWCQHHNGIWRSADGAASWQRIEAPVSSFGFAVAAHPHDPDTAWFVPAFKDECRVPVGAALVVNRTRDGGKSFETLREGLPQHDCYDLVFRHALDVSSDGDSLLLGSSTGHLWSSADGGDSWQAAALNLPEILALKFG
ncbi:MAG: exo-alpha-sialidase [Burkholderiales bacterium]|nr:exo-alpha-sialidase [Burkholderiales bacterium]MDE2455780.1 exo-alpha-sialidase [Burkholderiales bacterium]